MAEAIPSDSDKGQLLSNPTQARTGLTPLVQQRSGALGLCNILPQGEDGGRDVGCLLGQVVGADQPGTLDVAPVQMLQTQRGRLRQASAARALPQALADLSDLLATWHASEPVPGRTVEALPGHPNDKPIAAETAQAAYKAQHRPPLDEALVSPQSGPTGGLARQPWRIEWNADFLTLAHPTPAGLSAGQLGPMHSTPKSV